MFHVQLILMNFSNSSGDDGQNAKKSQVSCLEMALTNRFAFTVNHFLDGRSGLLRGFRVEDLVLIRIGVVNGGLWGYEGVQTYGSFTDCLPTSPPAHFLKMITAVSCFHLSFKFSLAFTGR
ncbi:hypothetical protein D9758_014388 [Tetrapyrgos nigripes]|uniref:Uncharacterized protein n=1 Tax=Tetrapyrgos nigripes TaxID=182062 RepID=A0A8H5FRL8_9AGAR|nr:hypothetical protein D9758_014388 [Tetrapyrgos nigripes]